MNMENDNLIINRIELKFASPPRVWLTISKPNGYEMVGKTLEWLKKKIPFGPDLNRWIEENSIKDKDFLAFQFSLNSVENSQNVIELNHDNINPFKGLIFRQVLGCYLIDKGFFLEVGRIGTDISAYQKIDFEDEIWGKYRRIDFLWKSYREELIFNIGSTSTLISREKQRVKESQKILDTTKSLIYKYGTDERHFVFDNQRRKGLPERFQYKRRYDELKEILNDHISDFSSEFFHFENIQFKKPSELDVNTVFKGQNFMVFGNGKTAVNAIIGMREYGPYRKIDNPSNIKLLFIYQNRDDANNLYAYLKRGEKHFPGLLSYVGIPVVLAGEEKKLMYKDVESLPDELSSFLDREYPDDAYNDTLAIVIGPFKKYESDKEESDVYYQVKKMLLENGIASQFVSWRSIRGYNFHYSLPNIAIAILAKLGGIPWKLNTKKRNELIVGFNTKKLNDQQFLGSAVFFNNEGELGQVNGFHGQSNESLLAHLREAITRYTEQKEQPERLIIHYYKTSSRKEVDRITSLLAQEFSKSIPFAILEINDTKSRMDICFDVDYNMGMPQSGTFVKVGKDEYLLFNNNRFIKNPPRVEEELPIKVRVAFANHEAFHHKELISQVYEFSRLNWKGLKQKSQPVTITFSKLIAEFSGRFGGEIPDKITAQTRPWFL